MLGHLVVKLIAARHDVEVGVAVAVGVEESGISILEGRIGAEIGLKFPLETTIGPLQEKRRDLPLGPADVHIFEPVAIHVGHGDFRPFGRYQKRHQTFAVEVVVSVFLVRIGNSECAAAIGEVLRIGTLDDE